MCGPPAVHLWVVINAGRYRRAHMLKQLCVALACNHQPPTTAESALLSLLPPALASRLTPTQQDGYAPPLDWLPWVFEVFPLQSPWVQQRVAAADIHLLPAAHPPGHAQHNTAYSAVVVLAHSPLNQRMCAGIMAVDEAGVAAALQFVGSRVPHWVSYIDSGSRHSSGAVDPQLMLAPVLDLGRQGLPADSNYMCYLVYSRAADARGLPEVAGMCSRL